MKRRRSADDSDEEDGGEGAKTGASGAESREGTVSALTTRLKSLGVDIMLRHRAAVEARLSEHFARGMLRCLSKSEGLGCPRLRWSKVFKDAEKAGPKGAPRPTVLEVRKPDSWRTPGPVRACTPEIMRMAMCTA